MTKEDPRQKRWFCITEDTYLNEDFFNVIKKTGYDNIEIHYLGDTSNLLLNILDILRRLEKNVNFSHNLSEIEEDLIDEGFEGEELIKRKFMDFQYYYLPSFFYFFDTDRLYSSFFLEQDQSVLLKEKLLASNGHMQEYSVNSFYLVPSFPSLASFAWTISSYLRTKQIEPISLEEACDINCDKIFQTQQLYKEICVLCKLAGIELEYYRKENKKLRGYGKKEKKLFCKNKKHYPYLSFLEEVACWNEFYSFVNDYMSQINCGFNSLESLKISDDLIQDLVYVKGWYSTIPVFIEASRKN